MLKVVSGYVSDRFRRRKPLALLGYGLAALTKPVFPLADSVTCIAAARFVDRVGKGIRGVPRDAIVANVTPPELRDAAYGLRQSLDTVGAFAGPMLAILFLWLWAGDLRMVLWVAVVPAAVAVALLAVGIDEPAPHVPDGTRAFVRWSAVGQLPAAYWRLIVLTALFSLARLSEAFLVLRAQELHLTLLWIPMVMIVMSVVYALASYPAGLLAGGVFAGWLWSRHGSAAAFGAGALWALLTVLVLTIGSSRPRST